MGNTESNSSHNEENIINQKKTSIYDVKLDIPDIRDYEFTLPENQIMEIDNEYSISFYENIKITGNCINDLVTYILYYEICQNEKASFKFYPSSEYLQNLIDYNENNIGSDSSIKNILKLINKYGIVPDTVYVPDNLLIMKVSSYFKIKYEKVTKNINDIKNILLDNKLVIFNFTVYSSIDNKVSKKNKIITSPKSKDSVYGCYGGLIYGYNNKENMFNIILPLKDHWDSVYGFIPYETFMLIAHDIWILDLNIKKDYSKLFEKIESSENSITEKYNHPIKKIEKESNSMRYMFS